MLLWNTKGSKWFVVPSLKKGAGPRLLLVLQGRACMELNDLQKRLTPASTRHGRWSLHACRIRSTQVSKLMASTCSCNLNWKTLCSWAIPGRNLRSNICRTELACAFCELSFDDCRSELGLTSFFFLPGSPVVVNLKKKLRQSTDTLSLYCWQSGLLVELPVSPS
jgi:hypothetical protein